jgi:hypothetical protein
MNMRCAYCGAPVTQGTQFCGQCGRPTGGVSVTASAPVAPDASGRRRGVRLAPAVAGFVVVGLCLCGVLAAGVYLWRSGNLPGLGTPHVAVTTPAPAEGQVEVDEPTLQLLEQSVGRIEAAFRAGDVETVINLTHPARHADYGPIFEAHRGELQRVADLLATRRLVAANYGMAEYEVTEDGRTFSVTFEPWGETWYLSGL